MALYIACQTRGSRMATSVWDYHNQVVQEQLKQLRVQANLTQLELAERLGRPQSYVSKYECGDRRLDLTEIRSISIACNVTLPEFIDKFEHAIKDKDNID